LTALTCIFLLCLSFACASGGEEEAEEAEEAGHEADMEHAVAEEPAEMAESSDAETAESSDTETAESSDAEMEESSDTEMEESSDAPRVWFITPEDGATVTSPVAFEFGSENITIEPKGDIHEGAGHHHLGLNTECLPAGEAIPEADPWVHFGDGSAMIEMQLEPGEHTITIQIGDGEHVTLDEAGLCTSVTITVSE